MLATMLRSSLAGLCLQACLASAALAEIPTKLGDDQLPMGAAKRTPGPFDQLLFKVGSEYKRWGRVDDEMRWAPWLCRKPEPGKLNFSDRPAGDAHGQKLYSLFARQRDEFFQLTKDKKVNVGQTIVKQSWLPEEITDSQEIPPKFNANFEKIIVSKDPRKQEGGIPQIVNETDHFYPFAWKGDKVYKAGNQTDLFVMTKLDPKTPDTDEGWVYGVLSPDGKTVSAAGKIESCVRCHSTSQGDRLFGYMHLFEKQP